MRAVQGPAVLPGAEAAFWLYSRLGSWLLLTLPLVLLLYPDGRMPGRGRWRTAALVSLAATSLLPLSLLVVPSRLAYAAEGEPLPAALSGLDLDPTTLRGLPDAFWEGLLPAALGAVALSLVVPFAVWSAATAPVGPGAAAAAVAGLGGARGAGRHAHLRVAPGRVDLGRPVVAVTVIGAAVGTGIVRPGLVDIDALLGGTVLYVLLGAALLLGDLAVLAGTGLLLGDRLDERQAALLALALVAAVYLPLRDVLWRGVRRLVVGGREDPYRVVSSLAEQLEHAPGAQAELEAVARAVALAFRARYVRVEVDQPDGSRLLASTGSEPDRTRVLPVGYRGEEIGRLVLPARGAAGERFRPGPPAAGRPRPADRRRGPGRRT